MTTKPSADIAGVVVADSRQALGQYATQFGLQQQDENKQNGGSLKT